MSDLYISVISVAELFAGVRDDEEEKSLKQLTPGVRRPARDGEDGPARRTLPGRLRKEPRYRSRGRPHRRDL